MFLNVSSYPAQLCTLSSAHTVIGVCGLAILDGSLKVLSHGNLSDISLTAVAMCTHMEELALHGCSRISNHGLRLLATGSLLRHLPSDLIEYSRVGKYHNSDLLIVFFKI